MPSVNNASTAPVILSMKVINVSSWPQTVTVNVTGPSGTKTLTVSVPESGLMRPIGTIGTTCPAPAVVYSAQVVAVGNHQLTPAEQPGSAYRYSSSACS